MADLQMLLDLYSHMEWADAAVWSAALKSSAAAENEKLRDLLYHLHIVQHSFLRIWRSVPFETPYPKFEGLAPLLLWARSYYKDLFALVQSWDDEKLSAPMPMPWAERVVQKLGRSPEVTTIRETALQVALHSQYHRGQINSALRYVGAEPPLVDYIAWIWLGRPAADWPAPQRLP